jgi:hypothetical protein
MKITAPALASCALLVCLLLRPHAAAESTVLGLSHSPANPTPDDNITVSIQLSNTSEVNRTFVGWCQTNPILCYVPKEMRYIGDGVFAHDIGRYQDGQEMKYNVTIFYKNGTTTVTDTIHFTVKKPTNGGGNNTNNTNTTGGGDADAAAPDYTPYIVVAVVVVAVAAAAVVFMMRRGKPGSR